MRRPITNLKSEISNLKFNTNPRPNIANYELRSVNRDFQSAKHRARITGHEPSPSVRRLRAARGLRARDFAIRLRAAVAVELPDVAHLLDFVQIQVGDQQFILVAAGLRDDFAARIAEIA